MLFKISEIYLLCLQKTLSCYFYNRNLFMGKYMLLQGKRGLITGIANNHSIAYAIGKLAVEQGAEIALTYQGSVLEKRINPIAEELGCNNVYMCDVSNEDSIKDLFLKLEKDFGKLDFIVHAIAFSDREELSGRYIDTSLQNFFNTMNISCFSLTSMCKHAEKILNPNASILALTYLGAQKVIPNYNVMGVAKAALECSIKYLASDMGLSNVRVNAISAGPIKTLASSGIDGIRDMLKMHKNTSPLQRNTTQLDVANSSLYFLSALSSGVTGEIHYVDSGYNIMGMNKAQNNDDTKP
jgi:enoyl-[acyl-carrier protein] reductase I